MAKLENLLGSINTISESSGNIVKWLMFPLTGIVFGEVILRYIFNAPTIWAYEMTEYLFGTLSIMGGAYCMRFDQHVRMDLVRGHLSARRKAILDVSVSIFTFFFLGVLLLKGWEYAWSALITLERSGTVWNPPYWPFTLVLPISAFLFLLQALGILASDIIKIINGRRTT